MIKTATINNSSIKLFKQESYATMLRFAEKLKQSSTASV